MSEGFWHWLTLWNLGKIQNAFLREALVVLLPSWDSPVLGFFSVKSRNGHYSYSTHEFDGNNSEFWSKPEKCAISTLYIALRGNTANSLQYGNGKMDRHLETCSIKESINLRDSARVHQRDWLHIKGKNKRGKKKGKKIKSPFPVCGEVGWSERNCQLWWEKELHTRKM